MFLFFIAFLMVHTLSIIPFCSLHLPFFSTMQIPIQAYHFMSLFFLWIAAINTLSFRDGNKIVKHFQCLLNYLCFELLQSLSFYVYIIFYWTFLSDMCQFKYLNLIIRNILIKINIMFPPGEYLHYNKKEQA